VLRYSLERRESELMVPVREDLRIMKTYLNIHQLCLGERLKVEYSIDEGALDFLIPRLLLQPVIENAVIHGIAESRGGTITISVERRESMLEIVIADTGKGFVVKREELGGLGEAAPASGGAADSSHIGLGLVLRRAALHFGERHTLDIHSEPGRGTRVTLRIRIPDGEAA
jgi:two-component system sensor histidine kinase YesM